MAGKAVVMAIVGLVALSSPAVSADITIPPPAPATDWSGPYVGAHLGIDAATDTDNLGPTPAGTTADTFGLNGFVAGVYGGENWQDGQFVYGVEGDLDATNLTGSHPFADAIDIVTGTMTLSTDWQGFLKGRVGYLFDGSLVYLTGGLAVAHATVSVRGDDGSLDPSAFSASASATHFGGTIGAGVELALTDSLRARDAMPRLHSALKCAQTYDFGLGEFAVDDGGEPGARRRRRRASATGLLTCRRRRRRLGFAPPALELPLASRYQP